VHAHGNPAPATGELICFHNCLAIKLFGRSRRAFFISAFVLFDLLSSLIEKS